MVSLRTAHQLRDPPNGRDLQVGEFVLVDDPKLPRHLWRIARITQVMQGRDGLVRSCVLKTGLGQVIRRPVQLLYPLEI